MKVILYIKILQQLIGVCKNRKNVKSVILGPPLRGPQKVHFFILQHPFNDDVEK